jgi:hypothetical protein
MRILSRKIQEPFLNETQNCLINYSKFSKTVPPKDFLVEKFANILLQEP